MLASAADLLRFVSEFSVGGLGGIVIVTGLSRWLGDLWLGRILTGHKAKYDKEIEKLKARYAESLEGYKATLDHSKDLLRARIENSVLVTRAQFETEFEAYKRIFLDLAEVRLMMTVMHPMISVAPEDETREDRFKALGTKLTKLIEAHDKAVRTIESVGPFYPSLIFQKLNECLRVVRVEVLNVQTGGERTFSGDWSSRGEKQVDEFLGLYNEASDAVRVRLASLAILPQT
jgi:hypothetical protein